MFSSNPKGNDKRNDNENNPNSQMKNAYRPQLMGGQVPNRVQGANLGKIPNMDNSYVQKNTVNQPEQQDIQWPEFEELFGNENQEPEPVQRAQPVQPADGNFIYANNINDPQLIVDFDKYLASIGRAKTTRGNYKCCVRGFFDYLKIDPIPSPSMNDVLNYIRYKRATQNINIASAKDIILKLKSFFTWTSKYNRYPNIMLRVSKNMVDKIYEEENQVPEELSDPNSEDDEFRALEKLLGPANQQLQPIRRGQQLQPPQNAFSGLQQAQDYIELQQKKDRLKEMLNSLAGLGRIDDPKVKEAWELYLDIYIVGKNTKYKYKIKSYINEFLDCLEGDSKSTPSSENILNFIKSIREARNVSCGTAINSLHHIRVFFKFVSKFGIYDDITSRLQDKHIREIYGVVPPSKKPRISKAPSNKVPPVIRKRQAFKQMMQKDYPNHKLDPNYITAYIHGIKGDSDYFKPLLCLKEYLEKNHISELIINDITTFIVNNRDMFRIRGSIFNFLEQLKQFFVWTSKNTSLDGQILYPDIWKFLDGVDLIDALLMKFDTNHTKNKHQDSVKPESIRDLMECLGLETESDSEGCEEEQ